MRLSRTDWKYLVDTLMILALVGIVLIGLLMGFVIPTGRLEPGQSKVLLGLHRHQWGDIHLYLSLAFTALVIIHLVLSWSWIKGKARALFGRVWKAVLGLTLVAALVVPAVFWLAAKKNDPAFADYGEGGEGRGRRAVEMGQGPAGQPKDAAPIGTVEGPAAGRPVGEEAGEASRSHEKVGVAGRMEPGAEVAITGQMTLLDVERATGVPARDIADRLGLPSDISLGETLGRLRRSYGFEMQAVRDVVAELRKERRTPALT